MTQEKLSPFFKFWNKSEKSEAHSENWGAKDAWNAALQKAAEIAKEDADGFYVDAAKFEHPSPIYTSLAKRGDVASHIEREIRKLME